MTGKQNETFLFSDILSAEEKAVLHLRGLYRRWGYQQFRFSKFEEYDLYAKNKSFLKTENIITFSDSGGRLLALKPDVTMSIVKNLKKDCATQKIYYSEKVYRSEEGSFREITQAGLEVLGETDDYALSEVVYLARESLALLSDEFILDLSQLEMINGLLDETGAEGPQLQLLVKCLREKNAHELRRELEKTNARTDAAEALVLLTGIYSPLEKAENLLGRLVMNKKTELAAESLTALAATLKQMNAIDRVNLDFSIVDDREYYNGIVMRGFVEGLPEAVLSGGQYDFLMRRLQKKGGAAGFAVYCDSLSKLEFDEDRPEVDAVLEYDQGLNPAGVLTALQNLSENDMTVQARRHDELEPAGGLRFGLRYHLSKRGLEEIE